jgi:hypothetical protein
MAVGLLRSYNETVTAPAAEVVTAGALAAAEQIECDWWRSRALRQLAPNLPAHALPQALALAHALASPIGHARTLLAPS